MYHAFLCRYCDEGHLITFYSVVSLASLVVCNLVWASTQTAMRNKTTPTLKLYTHFYLLLLVILLLLLLLLWLFLLCCLLGGIGGGLYLDSPILINGTTVVFVVVAVVVFAYDFFTLICQRISDSVQSQNACKVFYARHNKPNG